MLSKKGKFPDVNKAAGEFKRTIPARIANMAKNHYLDGFKKGGYQTDNSLSGWAKRKRLDKKGRGRRAILIKTGQLRNDLDVRRTTLNEIVLGTNDTPYASFNNDGTDHLPQREFLGRSRKLNNKISKFLDIQFKKVFK